MAAGKTLAELVKINDKRLSGNVVDQLLEDAPLIRAMAAVPASNGTDHKWLQYTTAPPGGFRALNAGIAQGQSVDTLKEISCQILDFSYHLDVRAVENYTQGDLISRENARHLRSLFADLERQVINGNATGTGSAFADAAGFAGIVTTGQLKALSSSMVVGAGGTPAGAVTSVYLLRSTDSDAAIVTGSDGNVMVTPPWRQFVDPANDGNLFEAFCIGISSYYAYQHGGTFSAARIANIDPTGATGQTLDDDLIANAISRFPATRKPNLIAMNRDAERQLRANRTATNPQGIPAPFAESAFGIPIVITDQIGNDETVVT